MDGRNPFRTTQETMVETFVFVGIYWEIESSEGFLRWCEMDFGHPQ